MVIGDFHMDNDTSLNNTSILDETFSELCLSCKSTLLINSLNVITRVKTIMLLSNLTITYAQLFVTVTASVTLANDN